MLLDRLIEVGFPVRQVSLDSVHEKNVRHGHVSTLHIWPARRPLAACRAALIGTLLGGSGGCERNARRFWSGWPGRMVKKVERKRVNGRLVEKVKEETAGGILHWGREKGEDLAVVSGGDSQGLRRAGRRGCWIRSREVARYRWKRLRLGCDVTAIDINPVAWFILKCTLEYPQRLCRQEAPASRILRCTTWSSWPRSSRRRVSREPRCARCSSGLGTATAAKFNST